MLVFLRDPFLVPLVTLALGNLIKFLSSVRSRRLTISSMDMHLSKLWEIVEQRETWSAAVHGVTVSRTWLSHWTTTRLTILYIQCRSFLWTPQLYIVIPQFPQEIGSRIPCGYHNSWMLKSLTWNGVVPSPLGTHRSHFQGLNQWQFDPQLVESLSV